MPMTNDGTSISRFRRAIAFGITLFMLLSHSVSVIAQSIPDIEAPLVEFEFVEIAPADTTQVFTAQAFDDIGLGDVSLHHRRAGENVFIKTLMTPVGDTGFFSTAIDTDPSDLRSFEYYAQALDLNGNRTVSGFAFDPFIREITEAVGQTFSSVTSTEPTVDTTDTADSDDDTLAGLQTQNTIEQPAPRTSNNRRWLYIALGVLAAGAVASQLGGSGGSSDGSIDTGNDSLVPLTVTIGDPLP